jgi:hypothetical protein
MYSKSQPASTSPMQEPRTCEGQEVDTSDSDILQMDGIAIPIDAAFAISLP